MLIYPEANIYSFQYDFPEKKWKVVYNTLVMMHIQHVKDYSAIGYKDENAGEFGYNFACPSYIREFDELYSFFKNCVFEIFGSLTLKEENKTTIFANISDKFSHNSKHDHKRSATINSVFYFSQPDAEGGEIEFFLKNGTTIKHKPKQGELVVFPGDLEHLPYVSQSDDYRIALNMEMRSEEHF
jgi:hypothetical protein